MPFDAAVIAAHAAAIPASRWFGLVGLPFSDQERAAMARLAPRAVRVPSWGDARRIADDARANAAYDADTAEVVELKARALRAVAPDTLQQALSEVVDGGLEVFFRSADTAARRARFDDETTVRAAAGSAAEAVYRGALAAAVAGPGHRFTRVEALFASGRWPLARIADTLYVF